MNAQIKPAAHTSMGYQFDYNVGRAIGIACVRKGIEQDVSEETVATQDGYHDGLQYARTEAGL